jgi:tRNA A-37 threonylcarbamoyl transferase component Bud32
MWSAPPLGDELRSRFGKPKRVSTLASSPRSRVWRARLDGRAVVVKQLIAGPGADERYARELAALQAASALVPPVVPRVLGTHPAERVLVLEYVEEQPPAKDWVVGYAAALARLHGSPTAGAALPVWAGPTSTDIEAFLKLAAWLGVPAADEVGTELETSLNRLAERSQRADLLHGDPCPNNDLHTADGVRFVDFEQASLGDGMVELAYLRIGFPTCWCSTAQPPELLAEAEAAYAAASGRPIDEPALADACAGWLIRGDALVEKALRETRDHLTRLTVEDWKWGTVSARERLAHRLGVVGATASDDGPLSETARLAERMRKAMLKRWPGLRALPAKRP